MRVIGTALLLATIMAIKVAGLDVSCELTDDEEIAPSPNAFGRIQTVCYFKNGTEIHEPSKLTNPRNEDVTRFLMTKLQQIEFLPQDLSVSFPNLKKINAEKCSVKEITKLNFHGLTQVIEINLEVNQIETIDENSFEDLHSLTDLRLSNNKITNLPAKLFANLKNLDFLSLLLNRLTKLDTDLFKNNMKISTLQLDFNELQTLPTGTFDSLTEMLSLSLSGNKIVDLPPHIFDNCKSLEYLHLDGNKIETIDINLLSQLGELRVTEFSSNPFSFIDFAVFNGNPKLGNVYFGYINTTDIRNIDYVDQFQNCFIVIGGKTYGKKEIDELKEYVKKLSQS